MAFTPKQQIAAMLIGATFLAGGAGFAVGTMGDSENAPPTPAPAEEAVTVDPYAAQADRAQNHGERGALVVFNEAARHFDVFDNPQNYTPEQARTAMYGVMSSLMTETNNLAQSTLTQYGPEGNLQDIDPQTASDLYTITQETCADVTAGDADGHPDPTGYFDEFNGQGYVTMLTEFVNDINRCIMSLEALPTLDTYLDANGQTRGVSAEFRQASFPVNQDWANIIKLHNDSLGASTVINDADSRQRLVSTVQQMQQRQ